jgi:translation initiation factor eIF-2B subunit delta
MAESAKAAKAAAKARRKAEHEARMAKSGASEMPKKPKLTKAQRREQQEAQRQAKQAVKTAAAAQGGGAGAASGSGRQADSRRARAESVGARMFSHLPQFSVRSSRDLQSGESPSAAGRTGRRPSAGGPASDLSERAMEVHPAVLRLGLMIAKSDGVDDDSRCERMLAAFRSVVADFVAPEKKEFSKALDKVLGRQISFLSRSLPSGSLTVTMGNAVRHLRSVILTLPRLQEQSSTEFTDAAAREHVLASIDDWVESKITFAHDRVAELAASKIVEGDVVLVFVGSPAIEQAVIKAGERAIKFRVVLVDARPHLAGKAVLTRLVQRGVRCTYVLISALSFVMKEVTKVLLGAVACMSNGAVVGRAGTTMVACVAQAHHIPVLLCCETYKFCDQVSARTRERANKKGEREGGSHGHAAPSPP